MGNDSNFHSRYYQLSPLIFKYLILGEVVVDVKGHEGGSGGVRVGLISIELVAVAVMPHNHSESSFVFYCIFYSNLFHVLRL